MADYFLSSQRMSCSSHRQEVLPLTDTRFSIERHTVKGNSYTQETATFTLSASILLHLNQFWSTRVQWLRVKHSKHSRWKSICIQVIFITELKKCLNNEVSATKDDAV